jgi:hypothetical protein
MPRKTARENRVSECLNLYQAADCDQALHDSSKAPVATMDHALRRGLQK